MSLLSLVPTFVRSHLPATASTGAEGERSKPSLHPHYQIEENADAWVLTVVLPGVAKTDLNLSVEDGAIHLTANRAWKKPEGWTARYRETRDLPYELFLSHENEVNLDAVKAEFNDGILTVTLPKAEARKPRKIVVS